jgi:hypothetical protein
MPGRYDLLPILTRLALDEGDGATAATAAALAAADAAQAPSMRRVQCAAEQCQALLTGDPAPAAAAAAYHGAAARPLDQAVALEDAAALAAAAGDLAAARRDLSAASALYAGLGARWQLRRAAGRLRPYGVRRGRGAGQGPAGVGLGRAHPDRGGGGPARGRGPVQLRHRGRHGPVAQHRAGPCLAHPGQARRALPRRGQSRPLRCSGDDRSAGQPRR